MDMKKIKELARYLTENGAARVLVVGGAVRDSQMGNKDWKDIDVEVYGMSPDKLQELLESKGKVDAVGKSFGVLKYKEGGVEFDVSLPRRESKRGRGHKGFMVDPDPTMTPEEAASRRDFTMNALAFDPLTGETLDFFKGLKDIEYGLLRHTSPAFAEDPLRVLRGMQFTGRFDMAVWADTSHLCNTLKDEYKDLPVERVWEEWWKWATKSIKPSSGLVFLEDTCWLDLYPQLTALIGVTQDPEWHPEGCAWTHTKFVVDAAAEIAIRDELDVEDRGMLVLSALCHDVGKAKYTKFEDGRWRSRGHERGGVPIAEEFLDSIGCHKKYKDKILPMVGNHMAHNQAATSRAVRRLAKRLEPASIVELARLCEADHSGRPPLPRGKSENCLRMLEIASEKRVLNEGAKRILNGRDLIEAGLMEPSKELGVFLKKAYEAQMDGAFADQESAMEWAKKELK